MISGLAALARPLLLALDPERAHALSIAALRTGLVGAEPEPDDPRLAVDLWDLRFPNSIGMAAGFDKHGEVPDALLGLGFGFVEIGTVAPNPQPGNPRPRVFRLPAERAIINRYGFNTEGHAAMLARLLMRTGKGIVGINIGANKDSTDRADDYVAGVHAFARHAGYLTINISSPNTPGLRDLQHEAALEDLLGRVSAARDAEAGLIGRRVPLALKIAPDLADAELDHIAAAVTRHGIDAVIVSNTTLARTGLTDPRAREPGGLSGRPLFHRSTVQLARMRQRLPAAIPLIGAGGVDSGETAWQKLRAGASLVQLYTGLVYEGLGLVRAIKRDLLRRLRREGFSSLGQAVGTGTDEWAARDPAGQREARP